MATDIRTSELKNPIDVAEYLFRRLHEVGLPIEKSSLIMMLSEYSLVLCPGWDSINPWRSRRLQSCSTGLHLQSWVSMDREL